MTVKTKVSPRELEPYDLDTPLRGAWRHKLKIKPVYDATLKVKTNVPSPRRVVTLRSSVNAKSLTGRTRVHEVHSDRSTGQASSRCDGDDGTLEYRVDSSVPITLVKHKEKWASHAYWCGCARAGSRKNL